MSNRAARVRAFANKPFHEKAHVAGYYAKRGARRAIKQAANKLLPKASLPRRLEEGPWWLAANDWVGDGVYEGSFERNERRFVERALATGMTMIDVGAHHGLYSLIAAKAVGPTGNVIAFEPSPRERQRLERHKRINHFHHLQIEPIALGARDGRATLYLPPARGSGFNSLRPAKQLQDESEALEVQITTLDGYLARHPMTVDLMKIDVEGGELDVLQGACTLLASDHNPGILCEVEDDRTEPWGYKAMDIIEALSKMDYEWFLPLPGGRLLHMLDPRPSEKNLVALPKQRRQAWTTLIQEAS